MSFNETSVVGSFYIIKDSKYQKKSKFFALLKCETYFLWMDERHVFATTNNKKNVYHVTIILTYYLHQPVKHWLT